MKKTTITFFFWVAVSQFGLYRQVDTFITEAADEEEAERKLNDHFKDKEFGLMNAMSRTVVITEEKTEDGLERNEKMNMNRNALPHLERKYDDIWEYIVKTNDLYGHFMFADKDTFLKPKTAKSSSL